MIKLKLNIDLQQHKAGIILSLKTDDKGNILDNFWFRRLKDSIIDNCVEIVKDNNSVKIVKEDKKSKKRND